MGATSLENPWKPCALELSYPNSTNDPSTFDVNISLDSSKVYITLHVHTLMELNSG